MCSMELPGNKASQFLFFFFFFFTFQYTCVPFGMLVERFLCVLVMPGTNVGIMLAKNSCLKALTYFLIHLIVYVSNNIILPVN